MLYGYIRFSTDFTDYDSSLDAQSQQLKTAGCKNITVEPPECGNTFPVIESLIQNVISTGDTLIVTKIDRLARTIEECIGIVQNIFDKGASVIILDIGKLENNESGRLFISTLKAVDNFNKHNKKYYMKNFSHRGTNRAGRPPLPKKQMHYALELLKYKTFREVCELTGISRSSLARSLKTIGIRKRNWK